MVQDQTMNFILYFCPINCPKFKGCPQNFHQYLQSPCSSHCRRVLQQHNVTAKLCMYWIFTLEVYWCASLWWMPPCGSPKKAESCRFTTCVHHRIKPQYSCWYIYRVSQEECARLREGVPYFKVYRYNPKRLCPKLNGYRDNGQRSLKLWQLLHTYWLPNPY